MKPDLMHMSVLVISVTRGYTLIEHGPNVETRVYRPSAEEIAVIALQNVVGSATPAQVVAKLGRLREQIDAMVSILGKEMLQPTEVNAQSSVSCRTQDAFDALRYTRKLP